MDFTASKKNHAPYKIINQNGIRNVEAHFEISVDCDGLNYALIYGQHDAGGFCAIPNHGIACEMGNANDVFYNTEALLKCDIEVRVARALAFAIQEADKMM